MILFSIYKSFLLIFQLPEHLARQEYSLSQYYFTRNAIQKIKWTLKTFDSEMSSTTIKGTKGKL